MLVNVGEKKAVWHKLKRRFGMSSEGLLRADLQKSSHCFVNSLFLPSFRWLSLLARGSQYDIFRFFGDLIWLLENQLAFVRDLLFKLSVFYLIFDIVYGVSFVLHSVLSYQSFKDSVEMEDWVYVGVNVSDLVRLIPSLNFFFAQLNDVSVRFFYGVQLHEQDFTWHHSESFQAEGSFIIRAHGSSK